MVLLSESQQSLFEAAKGHSGSSLKPFINCAVVAESLLR